MSIDRVTGLLAGSVLLLVSVTGCVTSPPRHSIGNLYQLYTGGEPGGQESSIVMARCTGEPIRLGRSSENLSESYLPFGCANQINLLMTVENRNDLLQGREMGDAIYNPVNQAASEYIFPPSESQ